MKIAVDLHIHSGLSPCADDNMTPNNIINMAKLKGLDAIAITDHNSMKNVEAFIRVAEQKNIICIPGVELTTKEEVHILALFKDLDSAHGFQNVIDFYLPHEFNNKALFGNQLIYTAEDEIIGECGLLLSNSLKMSVEETIEEIRKHGGIPIPAHVNRNRFSIISNLGFVNPDLRINSIEVCYQQDLKKIEKFCPHFEHYNKITSSDAHSLGQVLEREFFIEVQDYSVEGILNTLDYRFT